jgi:4-amino-4-deoxy-L-arabinose transferase-like glycosyltransferase
MTSRLAGLIDRRAGLVLLGVFVLLELLLVAGADGTCMVPGSDCSIQTDRYGFRQATAFLNQRSLVDIEDFTQPYTQHPPGYALLMAASFAVFGASTYLPIILLQLTLLIATAALTYYIAESVVPGYGLVAAALILLNPNIVPNVNITQTVAIEMFFLTSAFAAAVRYLESARLGWAMACGALIGVAMMVRPSAQIIAFILPVLFPLLNLFAEFGRAQWRTAILASALATAAAFVVIAPWAFHQLEAGEGFRLSSARSEHLILEDSLRYLTPGLLGRFDPNAETSYAVQETETLRETYASWDDFSPVEQGRIRRSFIVSYYLSFPFHVTDFAIALVKSWTSFSVGGGEGMMHRWLGMEQQPDRSPGIFYGTKTAAIGFSVLFRLLGIVGLIAMVMRRHYSMLLLTTGLVFAYVAGAFLVGQPRYRVPVEPALAIMAVYGVAFLHAYFRAYIARAQSAAKPR